MAAKYWSPPPLDPQKLTKSNFKNWINFDSAKVKVRRVASLFVVSSSSASTNTFHGPFWVVDPDTRKSLVRHCLSYPFPLFLIWTPEIHLWQEWSFIMKPYLIWERLMNKMEEGDEVWQCTAASFLSQCIGHQIAQIWNKTFYWTFPLSYHHIIFFFL